MAKKRDTPPKPIQPGVQHRSRLERAAVGVMVGAAVSWSIWDWIFVDEGIRYFREDWIRVLVLVGIVAAGAPALLGYRALSGERKRTVALGLVAVLALVASGFALHCVYSMARLTAILRETEGLWRGWVAAFLPGMIAACLWWAFSRLWRRKPL